MSELKTRKPSVRLRPMLLVPGDRIIFSGGMGGRGQTVTVEKVSLVLDTAMILVEEMTEPIEVLTHNTVKLAA